MTHAQAGLEWCGQPHRLRRGHTPDNASTTQPKSPSTTSWTPQIGLQIRAAVGAPFRRSIVPASPIRFARWYHSPTAQVADGDVAKFDVETGALQWRTDICAYQCGLSIRPVADVIIGRPSSAECALWQPSEIPSLPGLCGWDGPRLPIFLSTWIAPRCGPRVAQSVVVLCFPRDDDRAWSCRGRMGAVQQSWRYVTIRRSRATRSNIRYATTQPVHAHARHRQARS